MRLSTVVNFVVLRAKRC